MLLITVTCIVLEVMIRIIPNEYKYKKQYLDNESDSIEIIFLGASDAHSGLNPEYTKQRSFNAAHPAQSLDYCFEILKKYDNKWSKLEFIVIPVSYPSLFYKMGESQSDGWRVKNYTIYYNIKITKHLRSYLEILNGQLLDNLFRIYMYHVKNIDEIHCSEKGWYISSHTPPLDSLVQSGIDVAARLTIPPEKQHLEEMKSALDSIVKFSEKNECKVILCTPPVYRSYIENFDIHQYDTTIFTISKIAKENDNCTYINLLNDTRFKVEDFLNGDHLNGNGAKKLTLIIDSIINKKD